VDFVSDLPSSGAAFVDARLDSVNVEKDGSSSLATSAPMTDVLSNSVAVSTEKAVEKVIPIQEYILSCICAFQKY
jgi:hypothetical protein